MVVGFWFCFVVIQWITFYHYFFEFNLTFSVQRENFQAESCRISFFCMVFYFFKEAKYCRSKQNAVDLTKTPSF